MRDVDVNLVTHFITQPDSEILTVEDLNGKSFALGGRGSVEAGLLAYHYLKEVGIKPDQDLALFTFYDDRHPHSGPDQRDVVERVLKGEYDAGAVSQTTLNRMEEDGSLTPDSVRIFWSMAWDWQSCATQRSFSVASTAVRAVFNSPDVATWWARRRSTAGRVLGAAKYVSVSIPRVQSRCLSGFGKIFSTSRIFFRKCCKSLCAQLS